ncbi:MAG: AraC family transcriptional regulator [Ferruginibacter sp.]
MKPALEFLPKGSEESFVVVSFEYNYYPTPWHFHPEYEIVLVTESTGKRFIGDNISNFKPGNLVLLGSNLPHLYRNDAKYYDPKSTLRAKSIVVHFSEASFGEVFFLMPELKKVKQLLKKSLQGIEITGHTNGVVSKQLFELTNLKGLQKCLKLLEILEVISEIKKFRFISKAGIRGINEQESDRMGRVLDFLLKNFCANINRSSAAKVSNMSENAFSRYFKQRTRKTFAAFLIELRLNHAAKLLIEKNMSIVSVCYECGFNNISNFNRHFKTMYQTNPLNYRRLYLDKIK